MSITGFKPCLVAAMCWMLTGCGMVQSVSENTSSFARSILYKQVKTLHLDFDGRVAMNTRSTDMQGLSVPTMVRIYQLANAQSMEKASYEDLLRDADHVLAGDLLDQRSVVVKPGEGVQLDVHMNERTQMIGVIALFREPDLQINTWRLIIARDELDPDRARVIELNTNKLLLRPASEG